MRRQTISHHGRGKRAAVDESRKRAGGCEKKVSEGIGKRKAYYQFSPAVVPWDVLVIDV